MSADGSPSSAQNGQSRYQRAATETLRAVTGDPHAHQVSERSSSSNLKTKNVIPTDLKRPRRAGRTQIDDVLAAISGGGAGNSQDEGDNRNEDSGRSTDRDRTSRTTTDRDDDARREAKSGPPLDKAGERRAFDIEEGEGEDEAPRRKRGKTLQSFAEEHEVQPEAIYDLQIHLEEGAEPVTIGALKDHYKERRGFEQLRDDFEDYRSQTQSEIIQGRSQINRMVQLVAGSLPPTTLQAIGQQLEQESRAALDHNRNLMREWFPEWEKPAAANAARKRMLEVVSQYGFSDVEFMNVTDARLVRLLWDAIRKSDRYDALRRGIREEKATAKEPPAQRKHRPSANDQAKRMHAGGDTIGAIATLIGE